MSGPAAAHGKRDDLLVHTQQPFNVETPRGLLAEHALTPVNRFYVRNHGEVPEVDEQGWRVRVEGLVGEVLALSLDDLRGDGLPRREVTATIQCAGNRRVGLIDVRDIPGEEPWGPGATGTATWAGVALADVLARAGVRPGAAHVAGIGLDRSDEAEPAQDYAASIPLEKALGPEVLLAFECNGEPLAAVHGAPVRLVVPGWIGARSVKWLQRLEVRERPWSGWFQDVVYRLLEPGEQAGPGVGVALGEIALNADILVPGEGKEVAAGQTELRGYAYAGGARSVVRVEVSADRGESWTTAELLEDQGRWAWRRWRAGLELGAGEHELLVRAWDSAAAVQPEHAATVWNPKGYCNNSWGRVTVHVR